jgi:hypothetical protein
VKEEGLQGAGRGGGTDATEHPLTLARSSVGEEASSFEEPGGVGSCARTGKRDPSEEAETSAVRVDQWRARTLPDLPLAVPPRSRSG